MRTKLLAAALAGTMMITGAPAAFATQPTEQDYQNRPDETWIWECRPVIPSIFDLATAEPEEDCGWFKPSDEVDILGSAYTSIDNGGVGGAITLNLFILLQTIIDTINGFFAAIFISIAAHLSSAWYDSVN